MHADVGSSSVGSEESAEIRSDNLREIDGEDMP